MNRIEANSIRELFLQGYIEVFESNSDEMAQLLKSPHSNDQTSNSSNTNIENWREPVVRLRGLPYNSSKEDVTRFFNGTYRSELTLGYLMEESVSKGIDLSDLDEWQIGRRGEGENGAMPCSALFFILTMFGIGSPYRTRHSSERRTHLLQQASRRGFRRFYEHGQCPPSFGIQPHEYGASVR